MGRSYQLPDVLGAILGWDDKRRTYFQASNREAVRSRFPDANLLDFATQADQDDYLTCQGISAPTASLTVPAVTENATVVGAQSSRWQDVLNSVTELPELGGDTGRFFGASFVSPLRPTYEPEIDGAAWGPKSPVGNEQAKQTLGDLGKRPGKLAGMIVQGGIENKALKVAGEALRVGSSALDAGEAAGGHRRPRV